MEKKRDVWTVGDVLNAMSGSDSARTPDYVLRIAQIVQTWLAGAASEEMRTDLADVASGAERGYVSDLDCLFGQMEWAAQYADVVPAMQDAGHKEDAVILSVGPIVLDEGMRMLVDHAALFAAGACKRVWLVSDTWIIADIFSYMPHLHALAERGIEVRFILVTPWGSSEIPWDRNV